MRTSATVAVVALLAASAARADVVSMPDKIELSGKKIEILEIRDDEVVVRVAYGDITIPRQRVTAMKVDFDARLARLKEEGRDTPRALHALGRVCAQLKMNTQAATAYREALARPKVPEDILLPMAADLEGLGAWDAAHASYAAYLKLHPDNADVQAKARTAAGRASEVGPEPEPAAAPGPKIEIGTTEAIAVKPPAAEPAPPDQPAKPAEPAEPVEPPDQPEKPGEEPEKPGEEPAKPEAPKVDEGLEGRAGWSSEAWGSSAEISVGASEGSTDKMLRVWLAGAEKDKVNVVIEDDFDLSKKKALTFDIYNVTRQRIDLAVAFITRPGWKFFESLPQSILPTGQKGRTITIDLTTRRFKTADTKWRHKSPLNNPDKIIKMYFLIYTDVTGEWVLFNNIRFDPPDEPGAPDAAAPAAGPRQPKAPANPDREERVAAALFRVAQANAKRAEWDGTRRFLDRLRTRYGKTKFFADNRAAIDELQAKADAQPGAKPAEKPEPKPGDKPEAKPAQKPEPRPAEKPKPEAPPNPPAAPAAKPAPAPKAAEPPAKPAPAPKPAEPEANPEAKPEA